MITVEFRPAKSAGRDSRPRYISEASILEVPIIAGEPWTGGFDLDALVLVDVTDDRSVANLDVLVPREGWTVGLPLLHAARRGQVKRLQIAAEVLAIKSIPRTPRVFVSADGARVQVLISEGYSEVRATPVSSYCDALVVGNQLIGFEVAVPTNMPGH